MNEGKEPRPGMACEGWGSCGRPSCCLCSSRQEGSCKSCWEKTLDAFRAEGGLTALMKGLGINCRSCDAYISATRGCREVHGVRLEDDDFCSYWRQSYDDEKEESNE